MKLKTISFICCAIVIVSCNSKNEVMSNKENRLKQLNVNLMVENVQNTLEYYEKIGFTTIQKSPSDAPQWAMVNKDNVSLMFQSETSLVAEFPQLEGQINGKPLTLWIQVEDITKYYEQIKDKAKLVKALGVTEYNGATEFVIEDNNGFILHFSNLEL